MDMVNWVNETTTQWRVAPLSSSWIFIDEKAATEIWVDGLSNDTIVFEWTDISKLGALPLNTFVYLIMTFFITIFILMTGQVQNIVRGLSGKIPKYAPNIHEASKSESTFKEWLKKAYPPKPREPPMPSYTETVEKPRGAQVTSEDIRDCQSIIRKVYSLKVDAYNTRDAYAPSQPLVAETKRKANAGLAEIQSTVEAWATDNTQWSPEEWQKVCQIRNRIRMVQGFQPHPTTQVDAIEQVRA